MVTKPKAKRVVSIDFGLARIGLAISDEMSLIAMPLKTIAAEKKMELTVAKVIKELEGHQAQNGYELSAIVVGLPLLMTGKKGFLADEVQCFVDLLKRSTTVPVETWDERLTSVQAERSLRESNMSRKKRSKVVDVVAAVIILQNYLDLKNRNV